MGRGYLRVPAVLKDCFLNKVVGFDESCGGGHELMTYRLLRIVEDQSESVV